MFLYFLTESWSVLPSGVSKHLPAFSSPTQNHKFVGTFGTNDEPQREDRKTPQYLCSFSCHRRPMVCSVPLTPFFKTLPEPGITVPVTRRAASNAEAALHGACNQSAESEVTAAREGDGWHAGLWAAFLSESLVHCATKFSG